MTLCVFNPEHDLCLAKGRWNYVPPRSAVAFARRDAGVMEVLYPGAVCCSVYDVQEVLQRHGAPQEVVAWGWDAVVRHELLKRGVPEALLPSETELLTIRELQHRATVLELQEGCHAVRSLDEMEALLREREHWVVKAPWSGAGRGLRFVHGVLTAIDRDWLVKTVAAQRCVIAEPRREVVADVALEYRGGAFVGYSYFRTGSGVYKENIPWSDTEIEAAFPVREARRRVEPWLASRVWNRYQGPLGVDLMVDAQGVVYVSEINFRHTMGMVAHERIMNEKR